MRCHWFPLARMDGSRDGRERWSVVGGWLSAGMSPHYLMPPHLLAAGDGRNRTEINEARPDGPNRQERAHQAGAPESLATAIEEI